MPSFLPFGKAGELQILRWQEFAVEYYGFTLAALTLKPSDFCNIGVYITGYTKGDLNGYINKGQADIIVAKISPVNGDLLWLEGLGTAEFDNGNAICTDNRDDIVVTGRARGR